MYTLVLTFLNYKGFVIFLRKWLKMVKTKKNVLYPLDYLFVRLTLTLSVAIAIVE